MASPAVSPSTAAAAACRELAAVDKRSRRMHLVTLPARFAHAAVARFFELYGAVGAAHDGPLGPDAAGAPVPEGAWAVRWRPGVGARMALVGAWHAHGPDRVYVFARHTVALSPTDAPRLLRALEDVKPVELDARGLPLSWVPPRPDLDGALAALGLRDEHDDDATEVSGRAALPPLPDAEHAARDADAAPGANADAATAADADAAPGANADAAPGANADAAPRANADAAPGAPPTRAMIARWLRDIAATASLAVPTLSLAPAPRHHFGFTAGRIWYDPDGVPLRVLLVPCPNADAAEILATIVHELAHVRARVRTHGLEFKRALVALAEAHWGERWFAGARGALEASYRVVDQWVATGIRAALKGAEVPLAKLVDDGQLARVLMRLKKLRDLAADQAGRPEGIAASAAANDLVTTYGLGSAQLARLSGGGAEQMVDLWVPLEDGAVWRRTLAHAVAEYCDVFSLATVGQARMHFFGRHADVVTAEYLHAVSAARIVREADAHIVQWKRARAGVATTSGDTRREKTSFCDSAAVAFAKKLEHLKADDDARSPPGPEGEVRLDKAEDFALAEHDKRGRAWASGGRRHYRDNAAGRALGAAMEVLHGVGGGDAPKRLAHR